MGFCDYLKDKAAVLLINAAGMLLLFCFLTATGYPASNTALILFSHGFVLLVFCAADYLNRRAYFSGLFTLQDSLEEQYLIAEVMRPSWRLTDRLYREALRRSGRSAVEKIRRLEEGQREYKEYIEGWIHEVKTPVTAMKLICENNRDENTENLLYELGRVEDQVERALYYARMERVYQDYLIRPADLKRTVLAAVRHNRRALIRAGMKVTAPAESAVVSTDEKWVEFLCNQILSNCIKYRRAENPEIVFFIRRREKSLELVIEDNGIGIPEGDIGRVFEKGFTGKNGRGGPGRGNGSTATGLGLYLCRRLCEKMGLGIACEAEEGSYTRLILIFPDSDHNRLT